MDTNLFIDRATGPVAWLTCGLFALLLVPPEFGLLSVTYQAIAKETAMTTSQKIGGIAALSLGIAFIALLVLLVSISGQGYVPGSGNSPAKALAFAASSPLPSIIYLLYTAIAVLIVLIVSALAERLNTGAAPLMRLAMVSASVTSALFLAYAMLGWVGEPILVNTYHADVVTGTAAYLAVRVVSNALNMGAIVAAGWATLLSGWAARKTGGLPSGLAYLLMLAGALSVVALLVPPLSLIAPLLYIVWSIWLGIVLLHKPVTRGQGAPTPQPLVHENPAQ